MLYIVPFDPGSHVTLTLVFTLYISTVLWITLFDSRNHFTHQFLYASSVVCYILCYLLVEVTFVKICEAS